MKITAKTNPYDVMRALTEPTRPLCLFCREPVAKDHDPKDCREAWAALLAEVRS